MEKILVIDDSVSVRSALEEILKQRPIEVLSAATGMDGIALLLEQHPSLVICDRVLPDREGIAVARFVRSHPLLKSVPFILISDDSGTEEVTRAGGCDAVLRKPISPEAVLGILDRFLGPKGEPPAAAGAPDAGAEAEPARILVIDDSMSVRVALERLLIQKGYETTAVSTSAEGLRRLEAGAFDLLICDLVMPDMDGIELVRFVRESTTLSSIPVILVSGLGDAEIEEQGRLAGVDDVVRKPFTSESLLPKVERLLLRARATKRAPAAAPAGRLSKDVAHKVLLQLRTVAGVDWTMLFDAESGTAIDVVGIEAGASVATARSLSAVLSRLSELGAACARKGFRSGILQYEDGFLVFYEGPARHVVLLSLSDAGQLGLLNLLVRRKLPSILEGAASEAPARP